jgi:hypothetical protein
VPCRAEACVRACARGGGCAAGAVLAGPWVVRHTAGRGAFLSGVYWLLGMSASMWRVWVWRVACVRCGMAMGVR